MIASVSGRVLVRRGDHVVIECAGVGYRLAVSAETLRAVPAAGREASLHAHLVSREDSLQLYGFGTEEERELFLQLISVSGIGPKVALAVLSGGAPRDLIRAIASEDSKRFQAVPGIGKRTAERIIVELRDKVSSELGPEASGTARAVAEPRAEAREGLLNLGYAPAEAERLLDVAQGESAEELIGSALRAAAAEAGAGR